MFKNKLAVNNLIHSDLTKHVEFRSISNILAGRAHHSLLIIINLFIRRILATLLVIPLVIFLLIRNLETVIKHPSVFKCFRWSVETALNIEFNASLASVLDVEMKFEQCRNICLQPLS